jgi:hypothetical protein
VATPSGAGLADANHSAVDLDVQGLSQYLVPPIPSTSHTPLPSLGATSNTVPIGTPANAFGEFDAFGADLQAFLRGEPVDWLASLDDGTGIGMGDFLQS